MSNRLAGTIVIAISLIGAAGCGADGRAQREAGPTAAQPDRARVELTAENLTGLRRGLQRELEAVRAAQQRTTSAKTAQERGEAIQASFEQATIPLGAEAAGLPVDEYRAVRDTVDEIFRTLDIQGKIDGPMSMDMSRVDEATRQRLNRDPFLGLSDVSAAALRAQMDALVPAWAEYVRQTAVAG